MAPIRDNLKGYGLWRSGRARRIVPVVGDLEAPLLGLSEGGFDTLSREVDVVIHTAARVNLAYPYEALKGANVDGTREVLRLACRHKAKHLHYVSTNGIFPAGGHRCEENADIDGLAGAREDGYGQTKWVAEKLVRQAAMRGLPVSVYRPGNISGHSISGISNPRDFLGAVIAESLRIGAVPEVEGWRVEMTPVDFVSGAICHLANEPDVSGNTFHLAEPDPVPAGEVFGWFGEMGYSLERLSYTDWLEARRSAKRPNTGDSDVVRGRPGRRNSRRIRAMGRQRLRRQQHPAGVGAHRLAASGYQPRASRQLRPPLRGPGLGRSPVRRPEVPAWIAACGTGSPWSPAPQVASGPPWPAPSRKKARTWHSPPGAN